MTPPPRVFLAILLLLSLLCGAHGGSRKGVKAKKTSERRLFDSLMRTYDAASRPVFNATSTVTVNFTISLNQIHDLAEKNQTLITHVWIFEEWYDEMLQWNPKRFNGLQNLALPAYLIWLPDVYIFNNADKGSEGFVVMNDTRLLVEYTGRVQWAVPTIIKSSCAVDVRYFPFDNQHCFVRFGSWIYEETQLDLVLKQDGVDLTAFSENSELDLMASELRRAVATYDMFPGRYPQVSMYLHIRRKPLYYSYTVIAPTLVLCILTLFSFQLPCDNGDKVGIGLTVFLSLYVLQLAIAEHIPESNSLPLIGLFLTLVMTLNAISLVFATLVINIKKKGDRKSCPCVPAALLSLCKDVLARLTCTPFMSFYEFYGHCESWDPRRNHSLASTDTVGMTVQAIRVKKDSSKAVTRRVRKSESRDSAPGVLEAEQLYLGKSHDVTSVNNCDVITAGTMDVESPRDPRYEWFFVAEVLDKFLFLVFLLGMVVTITTSLVVIPWVHRND